MKRNVLSLVALVLIFSCVLAIPASAADVPVEEATTVTPRFVNISLMSASIDVTSSGKALPYSYVKTANSTYTIYLNMSLQRYVNGGWSDVKSWSTSGTGDVELDKSYYVTPGYYYRTATAATVYTSGGSYVETAYVYSQNYYY